MTAGPAEASDAADPNQPVDPDASNPAVGGDLVAQPDDAADDDAEGDGGPVEIAEAGESALPPDSV